MTIEKEFWNKKPLSELSAEEWEALCDGCGICCMYKIEDEDTGEIALTSVACRFLDLETITCQMYDERFRVMPTCIDLTPANVAELGWLPESCAYRLVMQGKPLPNWHPLISGDKESVHKAGILVRGRAIRESDVNLNDLEDYIVDE